MARPQKDLDLHKLEVFYWVAELGSFSEAAQRLSLRQPTVSAHIQDLEKGIGGKLFYRTPGKVSLTPLGEMIAIKASSLLAFKRETLSAVEQFHGTLSGELWIGGSNIPGEYLLPQKLGAFIQKYPAVRPILRIGDSAGVIEDVVDGKVELGYVGFKAVDARLAFETIWKDEMVLAIPKGHHWAARQRRRAKCASVRKVYFPRDRLRHSGLVSRSCLPTGEKPPIRCSMSPCSSAAPRRSNKRSWPDLASRFFPAPPSAVSSPKAF